MNVYEKTLNHHDKCWKKQMTTQSIFFVNDK